MYVCLCRGVSHTTVLAVIASGARTVEDVIASSTASSGCGRCRESIEHLLASALAHEQGEEA